MMILLESMPKNNDQNQGILLTTETMVYSPGYYHLFDLGFLSCSNFKVSYQSRLFSRLLSLIRRGWIWGNLF